MKAVLLAAAVSLVLSLLGTPLFIKFLVRRSYGQFIRDVIEDPLDDAAVRCFVDVARVVGVKTVAEFVDRVEVLERVRDIGIDFAQGYFLHKPEAIEAVLGLPAISRQAPSAQRQ